MASPSITHSQNKLKLNNSNCVSRVKTLRWRHNMTLLNIWSNSASFDIWFHMMQLWPWSSGCWPSPSWTINLSCLDLSGAFRGWAARWNLADQEKILLTDAWIRDLCMFGQTPLDILGSHHNGQQQPKKLVREHASSFHINFQQEMVNFLLLLGKSVRSLGWATLVVQRNGLHTQLCNVWL